MNEVYNQLVIFAPRGLGALALVTVGLALALIARRGSTLLLNRLGFDRAAERVGLSSILREASITLPPSRFVGTLLFWAIVLFTALAALGPLGLSFLATSLTGVFAYAPRLLVAVLLVLFGTGASGLVATLAERTLLEVGVTRTGTIAALVRFGIIFIALILAGAVLQLDVTILIVITFIVLGGIVLAGSLAVGLGLRELSGNIAAGRYVAEGIAEGDTITIDGISGTVERIGYGQTEIRDGVGQSYLVPNAHFMQRIVTKGPPEQQ